MSTSINPSDAEEIIVQPNFDSIGRWGLMLGIAMAVLIWSGGAGAALGYVGLEALLAASPWLIGGVSALSVVFGGLFIMTGLLYRESARTRAANAVLVNASQELLNPAEAATDKMHSLGFAVSRISSDVCANLDNAREQMAALNKDLAMTLSATAQTVKAIRMTGSEVISGVDEQRQNLETTRLSLRNDAKYLSDSVGENANIVTQAAERARANIEEAEAILVNGSATVESAAKRLHERAGSLEKVTADGRKRSMALIYALARINEQMDQSSKKVDAAIKAGDMAAIASRNTADALNAAVSKALERALQISEKIEMSSATAQEQAESALRRITEAGVRVETVSKSARSAAQEQADMFEQRFRDLSDSIARMAGSAADSIDYKIRAAELCRVQSREANDEAFAETGADETLTEERGAWWDLLEEMGGKDAPDLSEVFPSFETNKSVRGMLDKPQPAARDRLPQKAANEDLDLDLFDEDAAPAAPPKPKNDRNVFGALTATLDDFFGKQSVETERPDQAEKDGRTNNPSSDSVN